MSVRLYVCLYVRFRGKRDFLGPLLRYCSNFFFVQIPLMNGHLFCKYFVRQSVGNATKGFATSNYVSTPWNKINLNCLPYVQIDLYRSCAPLYKTFIAFKS